MRVPAVIVGVIALQVGCRSATEVGSPPTPCELQTMEQAAMSLLSGSVEECTDVDCILDAVSAGGDARWIQPPIDWTDSVVTVWLVVDEGRVWRFLHDDYRYGDAFAQECVGPSAVENGLSCESWLPEGTEYVICGGSVGPVPAVPWDEREGARAVQ